MSIVALGVSLLAVVGPSASALRDRLPVFERFGITTPTQLSSALEGPTAFRGRQAMWLRSWLGDAPGVLEEARALLQGDPLDLEAVSNAVSSLDALGDPKAAIALLEEALPKPLVVRDDRGGHDSRVLLEAWHCSLLQRTGDPRAPDVCRRAVDTGGHPLALRYLARIALRDGEFKEALALAQRATRVTLPEGHDHGAAWSWFLVGVAHESLGHGDEARDAFEEAVRQERSLTPAWRACHEPPRSMADRLREGDDALDAQNTDRLAMCATWYAELGLTARSERCLAETARRSPGRAAAVRVADLARTDPAAALRLADESLRAERNPSLLSASGWLRHRLGDDAGARRDLGEALASNPVHFMANVNLAQICLAAGDNDCADEHFARAHGGPDGNDVVWAVLKFVVLLVPVAIVYVVVRRRVVRP